MKKVTAWETTDGKLFKEKVLAEINEEKYQKNKVLINKSVNANYDITKYINETHGIKNPSWSWSIYNWDCTNKENPVEKCVYDSQYDYECCVYCGGPEERK